MHSTIKLLNRRGSKARPKGTSTKGFRRDIQGLRALAVLLVIADHLLGWPHGGFIGVDVFFVLSGFLITGLLIREHEKRGRISFANFYRRRARRILPLSVLVLLVTVGISWALFNSGRAMRVTEDGIWSLFFGMNWHLAIIGTDYMQADGIVSPLQHFWSLAVEEQFYVVWPWVVVLVLGLAASRLHWNRKQATRLLVIVMGALSLASFAFAMWETAAAPTFAYFSTFSRAWELGAGALLAALAPALHRLPDAIRPYLAYTGLAGIVLGALLINSEFPFPGPWAAVPVLATVLVLAAGCGGDQRHLQPLTNPVSRYLGDISYSLYLWHFPMIILAGALIPLDSPVGLAGVFAATLAVSALSFYFLEEPIRTSQWLEPKSGRNRTSTSTRERLTQGGVVALILVFVGLSAVALNRPLPASVAYDPAPTTAAGQAGAPSTPTTEMQENIQLALSTPQWPELSPALDQLGPDAKAPEWVEDGCLALERGALKDPYENALRCVYGPDDAAKTAIVFGDSLAISYLPGIRAALEPQGFKVMVFTMQQCAVPSVAVVRAGGAPHPDCEAFRDWAFENANTIHPDMMILSSSVQPLVEGIGAEEDATQQLTDGYERTFERLAGATDQLVVMDGPPSGKPLEECATRISVPSDCVGTPGERYEKGAKAGRNAAEKVKDAVDVNYLNTKQWFCATNNCPAFVENTPVYADGSHITADFSTMLGPVIAEALAAK